MRSPLNADAANPPSSIPALAPVVVAVVLLTLLIAALIFSNSFAARQVADDAVELNRAEATLGAAQVALKALSQAVLLNEDQELGVADAATAERATVEARRTIEALRETGSDLLEVVADGESLRRDLTAALAAGSGVVGALEVQEVDAAAALLVDETTASFEELRDTVAIRRNAAAASVNSATDLISRIGNLPAFLAAFLIPSLAILGYRRLAHNQLRVAEVQLEARLDSERMLVRAKDEFVANISHELRTPLTSIYGFSELLIDQGFVDPRHATELLSAINQESAELHRMVEDLLASARHESNTLTMDFERVAVDREIRAAVDRFRRPGRKIELELEEVESTADAARVRHVVRNLISNAHRHGGEIVRVSCRRDAGHVEIVVADNGSGVPAEGVTRLFTRYVHEGRDPLTTGSVGLGLAVVKILAHHMGGSVGYRRRAGWSEFTVRWPVSRDDGIAGEPGPSPDTLPRHLVARDQHPGVPSPDPRSSEVA